MELSIIDVVTVATGYLVIGGDTVNPFTSHVDALDYAYAIAFKNATA